MPADHHVTAAAPAASGSRRGPAANAAAEAAQRGGPRTAGPLRLVYEELSEAQILGRACVRCGRGIPPRPGACRGAGTVAHPRWGYSYAVVMCEPTCELPQRTPRGHWSAPLSEPGHAAPSKAA